MSTPTRIEPINAKELLLSWTDSRTFSVPYTELRFYCPCANCVDEHSGRRIIERTSVSQDVRVTGVQAIGRYALQLSFSDGHSTGIYPFEKLMKICGEAGRPLAT